MIFNADRKVLNLAKKKAQNFTKSNIIRRVSVSEASNISDVSLIARAFNRFCRTNIMRMRNRVKKIISIHLVCVSEVKGVPIKSISPRSIANIFKIIRSNVSGKSSLLGNI